MLLSESLVWALESYDISGVKVYCDNSVCEDAIKTFMDCFTDGWNTALQKVEQEFGDYEPADIPAFISEKDYGFFITVGALEIRYRGGDYYDMRYSYEAFENALKSMKTTHTQVEYEGYIGYPVSDVHAGEAIQQKISSGSDAEIFDFVGETIGKVLASELYVPEEPADAEEINFVVTGKLKLFENREEITEYIEDLGGNVTGSISKKTDYLINNDPLSTSSKNVKAKELGIPIISEREFVAKFGEADDFDIEPSEFWVAFAEQLECNEDFEETIISLYAYSEWIDESALDKTVRAIIDIAAEIDEDMSEELVELVNKLKNDDEPEEDIE